MSEQVIKKLSEREKCRDKIAVFYGSRDNYYHGFLETVVNSIDEIKNNFDNGKIIVTVGDDLQTISVFDTGRGIPLMGETDGIPNYVLLFETTFAGTNYENLEKGKTSSGTNGCGEVILQNTSVLYNASSYKDNKLYKVEYIDGVLQRYIEGEKSDIKHGTLIEFKLDDKVYTNTTYDIEEIKDILNRFSSTSDKITIELNYLNEKFTYHYDTIKDYSEENIINKLTEVYSFDSKTYENDVVKDGVKLKEVNIIEANISLSTDVFQQTYLNGTFLKENGSIYDGIIDGIRKFLQKDVKDKTKLTNQDIAMSFNLYCNVESTNVEFMNQTKFSTNKLLYKKIASQYIQENLEVFKKENSKVYQQFIDHVTNINSLNVKSENSIKNVKKKLAEKSNMFNRPEGLVDCREHGLQSELFIAEGKSALGSIVASRDSKIQACMPIRGKILSTLKVGYDKILANELIMDLIRTIGCGIEIKTKKKENSTFDLSKLRYGKIVLATDEDADAYSIKALLLVMIYRLIPTLLIDGYVYAVRTPLFEITMPDGKLEYAFTDAEKDSIVSNIDIKKVKIKRNKGLGEVDEDIMHKFAMNPDTRYLYQYTVSDVEAMSKSFDKWMGVDVTERKQYISENLYKYVTNLD